MAEKNLPFRDGYLPPPGAKPPVNKLSDRSEDDFHAHPHDVYFQTLYAKPEKAAVLLRTVLRREVPELEELVELDRLEPLTLTLSTSELRDNLHYDLLFWAPFRHTDEYLVFQCEHQSSPEKAMGARLDKYVGLILDEYQRQYPGSPRPMVCPVVVYANGQHRPFYRPQPESEDARKVAALLAPFMLRQGFGLLDANETADADLWIESDYPAASLGLVVMKVAPGNERIDEDLRRNWSEELEAVRNGPDGVEEITRMLAYVGYVSQIPRERVRALAASLGKEVEEKYMTMMDMFRAEVEASSLMKLLAARFGPVPEDVARDVQDAGSDQVSAWFDRAATAATLDEVFPDRRRGQDS